MAFITNTRLQQLLLFAVAFLLYANTLGHGFVLDDQSTITQNRLVQAGLKAMPDILSTDSFAGYLPENTEKSLIAGGRYRPLSLLCFAFLVQLFGTNSLVFHLFAVLLYAVTCLFLYKVLLLALRPVRGDQFAALVAWGTTLLFAAHPVHSEVVANVKSCDEQLALLAGLGVLYTVLKGYDTPHWKWGLATGILFLLACLAKENAVTLLLLAPLAPWFFRHGLPAPGPVKWPAFRIVLPLLFAFGVYIVLRGMALNWDFSGQVMHDPLNNPFLKSDGKQWIPFTGTEKAATILYTLFQYLRLLVWPHPLTHDYYPFQIEPQAFVNPAVIAAIALYFLLLVVGGWGLAKRKIFAFGILLYLLPLLVVANIFFPIGTFMAERFLYMPSLGFCLVLALTLAWATDLGKKWRLVPLASVVLLAVLGGAITMMRTPAWSNNKNLLTTDLSTSPNSAKLRNALGTLLLMDAQATTDTAQRRVMLQDAEVHLKRTLQLHPSNYDAILAYGACTFYLQQYDMSITAYRSAGRMNPQDPKTATGLAYALRYGGEFYARQKNDPAKAIGYLSEAWQLNPDTATATILSAQYETLGRPTEAAQWMEKAVALAPNEPRLLNALMKAYTAAGENAKAAEVEKRAKSFTTFAPETN